MYYRTGTYRDAGYLGSQWDEVDPDCDQEMVNIDVGDDVVVAANKKDQLFARDGKCVASEGCVTCSFMQGLGVVRG